ncbi:MAG: 50S ribosomal protein L9 [Candidatus Marinimicrobia bacterium]|nr:50S ribosomal protein L9 [Candidatus Neomarinimicrobiota bacterium]MCK9483064.1 50S ribosomal protein L9 [Candidatus Neomarinimicrobiota bacterium]MCK9559587.1 50S ribosomal protein L9 [Candidatus Neomarinimicrobiota bacterium]MDD5061057.1 50S ribosomal protein L9 [Candidatus Neomarinimicrobiota bacterium]MDD5230038.1 50S ribosomal protein L9 [Candidatus Neomarinimicrobiota bacterium]
MRVILIKDHEKLGKTGDTVEVKSGYARNYLVPQGIALIANSAGLKKLQEQLRLKELRQNKTLQKAREMADKLNSLSLTIPVQVGEEDRVFGAVTSQMIADQLQEKGYEIDKKHIQLDEPIKALGIFEIPIKILQDVTATVKLWVIKA